MTPHDVIAHLLRPLVRFAVASGLRYQDMAELVKAAFLAVAGEEFALGDRRGTVSRLSLLTGLRRQDVKARSGAPLPQPAPHPVARLLARWPEDRDALDRDDFEAFAREISQDVHPRTLLDEMERLGVARSEAGTVRLLARSLVAPGDRDVMLGYLARNVGDHASAAVANVLAAPAPGPNLDQAVHYNGLAPASVEELDRLARRLAGEALRAVNRRAAELQARDAGEGRLRIRFGAYFHAEEER